MFVSFDVVTASNSSYSSLSVLTMTHVQLKIALFVEQWLPTLQLLSWLNNVVERTVLFSIVSTILFTVVLIMLFNIDEATTVVHGC